MGWVTDRFHCTLKGTFKSLKTAVTIDVNEANTLLPEAQQVPQRFACAPGDTEIVFTVKGIPVSRSTSSDSYTFSFELHKDLIRICRDGPQPLPKPQPLVMVVKQRWNYATASCVLCMDGRQVSVEEISQIALEPMFFGV